MDVPELDLLKQIVSAYSVGELTGYQLLTRGYVNTSYAITTSARQASRKYLLRIYRRGITEAEVIFEHSIINHLVKKGFNLAAGVLTANDGTTYVRRAIHGEGQPNEENSLFCAIFDYLPGEDKYTWIRPECSAGELAESAAALARFHTAVCDLRPAGQRAEPGIIDLLPLIDARIEARLARRGSTAFEVCLAENQAFILRTIKHILQAIDPAEFNHSLHLVNHGDYHPGNLKFANGKVVGLFDLDWSKVDARIFDLGLALTYFCASWDDTHPDDYFQLDKAAVFLRAYQMALVEAGGLQPLDAVEIKYLPEMAAAGNIYVMEWALRDFYGREVDPVEYLGYLRHHLCLMRWFDDRSKRLKLQQMIAEAAPLPGVAHTISKRSPL